jgi:hypothetical protein
MHDGEGSQPHLQGVSQASLISWASFIRQAVKALNLFGNHNRVPHP